MNGKNQRDGQHVSRSWLFREQPGLRPARSRPVKTENTAVMRHKRKKRMDDKLISVLRQSLIETARARAEKQRLHQKSGTVLTRLTEAERENLTNSLVEAVASYFRGRVEEVLTDPDNYGGDDLNEIRSQICGAVADDLNSDGCLGGEIEMLLEQATELKRAGEQAPTGNGTTSSSFSGAASLP